MSRPAYDRPVNHLKALRGYRSITMRAFADRLGVDYIRLWRIEHEKNWPTAEERVAIAKLLSRLRTPKGRIRVTPEETGLKVDPLGATRGAGAHQVKRRRPVLHWDDNELAEAG